MDFDFRALFFKMLRRILELAHFHVPDSQPNWEFKELLDLANNIKISNKNLTWDDWHRYSNRQQRKMDIGGFIGDMTLDGNVEPFYPLLKMSEVMHVGKGTSFGLGKIIINQE